MVSKSNFITTITATAVFALVTALFQAYQHQSVNYVQVLLAAVVFFLSFYLAGMFLGKKL